jgi:hypothetical protein
MVKNEPGLYSKSLRGLCVALVGAITLAMSGCGAYNVELDDVNIKPKNTFNLFDVTLEGGIQGVSETSNYKVSRVMIGGDVRRQVCSSPSYKVHGGMFSGL